MTPSQTESNYYHYFNMSSYGSSAHEIDVTAYTWVQPVMIDDEDLTFGGKALSTWYEEERTRLSHGSDDGEERRGRERVRRQYPSSGKSHKK